MSTLSRSMSLVERKKLQWAKEREELASLCGPWGPSDQDIQKSLGRTRNLHITKTRSSASENRHHTHTKYYRARYESKLSMVQNGYLKRELKENTRRGSLPPLYKNQYNSYDRYERDKELGGETSGYGSDNPNHTPDCVSSNWHQSGYESSSSRDDRPKWGDKGVGVGKFWQPKEEHFEKDHNEPPNWVKRGLQDGEIVVTNTSPAESPEQRFEESDRPCTGSSVSRHRNSYIRGQNIHIDSVELAERERKRQIAMAHQEAIRQQLEDRERRRREERDKRIKEEHEEELRIEREQEIERQRKEHELRLMREKQERERKRKEAIQEAIALAQKTAEMERSKRLNKQASINKNITENVTDKDKILLMEENTSKENLANDNNNHKEEGNKPNNYDQLNNTRNITPRNETLNNEINNNLEIKGKNIASPRSKEDIIDDKPPTPVLAVKENINQQSHSHTDSNSINMNNMIPPSQMYTPRTESLALVIQTPLDALQSVQYALLVPVTPQTIPVAMPINTMQIDRSCNTSRTENRILTPTQYRNRNRRMCDSATQTENLDFTRFETDSKERFVREKLTNIELTYDNRSRKGRRSRSESLEERPKWGANRPPTRYLKQSEKDPLYQRRKLRQRMRGNKLYDDKNSSDESQTATTPRSYRKKSYMGERSSRPLWRKDDHLFSRNIRMYQTEIVPLESDKDQIYYKKHECCCVCRCDKRNSVGENIKVDILRIEQVSPRDNMQYKAEIIESSERLPNCNTDDTNHVLEKISSLHNGLLQKQEQWEKCPRTPSLSPPIKN